MAARPPVYVLGDANVDILMPIDEYPAHGGDKRSERTIIEAGGSAANTAAGLAKLDIPTALLAAVGRDVLAELAVSALGSAGVILKHLQSNDETTGIMFVPVTPDGQRTLFGRRGANRLLRADQLPLAELAAARALHLSGYALLEDPQGSAAREAFRSAGSGGAFRSLDTAYEPPFEATDAFGRFLPQLDLLILGEPQAEVLAGGADLDTSLARLLDMGVGTIALKRGRRGSLLVTDSERRELPALPVTTVDSTGAGDSYSAGLLFGLLEGFTLAASGLLASAAGALATARWGAGAGAPGRAELIGLIAKEQSSLGAGLQAAVHELLDGLQI